MHGFQGSQTGAGQHNSIRTQDLLCKVIGSLPDLLFVLDRDLNVVLSNWADQRDIGGPKVEGRPCYQVFMKRESPCEPCHAMAVFETGQPRELEHLSPVDGQVRNIQVLPVFDEKGRVVMVIEHLRDITKQKKDEEVLARLSNINAGLAELGKEMLRFASRDDVSRVLLEKACELTDSPCGFVDFCDLKTGELKLAAFVADDPLQKQIQKYSTPPAHRAILEWLRNHQGPLLTNEPTREFRLPSDFHTPIKFRRILSVPAILGGETMGQITVFNAPRGYTRQDLAVLERMASLYAFAMRHLNDDQALMDYQKRLRSLAAELSAAENRERRLIASDLHDSVGQYLSMANQRLKMLRLDQPPPPQTLDQIIMLIDSAIMETRSLTAQLSPPVLYLLGLEAALEWLSEISQERFGLELTLQDDGSYKNLDHEARGFIFRAITELLSNVAKHAGAGSAKIEMATEDDFIKVSVIDQGKGFDYVNGDPFDSEGFGLFSIRERISALGGSFEITSKPNQGTTATLSWPLGHGRRKQRV
jgi:signal transduction histidine kinase